MTAEQIHLLRRSFDTIERQAHVAALVFYRRLFELDPSLRPMFQTDIEVQSRKLIDMLGLTLSLLDRPTELEGELEQLGLRHVTYGVKEAHYDTVGLALLGMLSEVLGEHWTPEVRSAWTELYGFIATSMKRGAAALART
jgi:hemoglobin-like flavoprotein